MTRLFSPTILLAIPLSAAPLAPCARGEEPGEGEKLFALKVQPLFAEKCLSCHGEDPEKIKGGFDLRTREALLRGGETFGPDVLVEGRGEESVLYRVVARTEPDYEMPPKESERLGEEESWWIRDWIDAGAPWPNEKKVARLQETYAEGVQVATSGGLSEDWTERRYDPEDLWAYRPVEKPAVPDSQVPGEKNRHPVDAFLETALAEAGLEPAPRADPLALIRRVTFDLTGLPPRPEEVDTFLAASERDPERAWRDLVDRLLGSPHYGEQQARHWLDVVRYADSSGFANDYERPNAWRYRDYVVRAFNADKPYDQFVREQIAGDEIGKREDAEGLIATGFLRMGPWEHTGMSVAKVTRQQFLDDVTNSVGQVFLAHALRCARCHDHKFDPVPTRDYYAMQAVFATTQFAEVETGWLPEENREGMAADRRLHERRIQEVERRQRKLDAKMARYEAEWFAERGLPWKTREEAVRAGAGDDQLPPKNRQQLLREPRDLGLVRALRKWRVRFDWERDRYRPIAFTVYNGKTPEFRNISKRLVPPEDPMAEGVLEKTRILAGGDPFAPADPVAPGVLSAVPGSGDHPVPDSVSGRRTALAGWIADPDNPLTARVMVNRIWQSHFGSGLAGNPNNFGATGKKPTHPALLDWLAAEFVERGWSVKAMHRLILGSEAYRRSSRHPDPGPLAEKDPGNRLLAAFPPRRLAAEELRDAMLAVSGELNPEPGGLPAKPDMNREAALQPRLIMGTFAPAYMPDPSPERRNRRTLYALKLRGQRDPFLEVFNQPGPDDSCERRETSNVTPQVFSLLNSEESRDRALAMARRVLAGIGGEAGRSDKGKVDRAAAVDRAFRLAYGRAPAPEERKSALAHWREMETVQARLDWRPEELPAEITRRANEENTGEIFTFTERLFAHEEYVPDTRPDEADARTRALADLCLVLLNSNEFVYVY